MRPVSLEKNGECHQLLFLVSVWNRQRHVGANCGKVVAVVGASS